MTKVSQRQKGARNNVQGCQGIYLSEVARFFLLCLMVQRESHCRGETKMHL
jgi:hypothetical protein